MIGLILRLGVRPSDGYIPVFDFGTAFGIACRTICKGMHLFHFDSALMSRIPKYNILLTSLYSALTTVSRIRHAVEDIYT